MMMQRNKYHAKKVAFDGKTFDSKKEARRWAILKAMQDDGIIHELERQVKFELIPSQKADGKVVERACTYKADFVYKLPDGEVVVEDAKGMKTKDYVIKRKLMLFVHGIRITEV